MKSFEKWKRERLGLLWWLIALYTGIALLIACTGCSPRVTSGVQKVRTDTIYVGRDVRDSIYVRDSLYIHEYARGETIYVERTRWREFFTDRWKRDTVYESRVDTCIVYREVIQEPNFWQRSAKYIKDLVLIAVIMLVTWAMAYLYAKTNKLK